MTPWQKLSLCILLFIVSLNIFLYSWFSGRVKEASAAIVVQKAYIISRMISDVGGRALSARQPGILRSSVEEALKDRHLVAVIVKRNSGETFLETSAANPPEKLSTFETPVMVDGKTLGTVITRFRHDGESSRLASRIATAAAVQTGLFAIIAALMAGTLCWERRKTNRPSLSGEKARNSLSPDETVLHTPAPVNFQSASGTAPLLLDWHPEISSSCEVTAPTPQLGRSLPEYQPFFSANQLLPFPQLFASIKTEASSSFAATASLDKVSNAEREILPPYRILAAIHETGDALRDALEIMNVKAWQRREIARQTLSLKQEALWSKACGVAAQHSDTLVTAAIKIITMIQQECRPGTQRPTGADLSARMREVAEELLVSARPDPVPTMVPAGEAALFRDIEQGLLRGALPDLVAALSANEISATLIKSLGDQFSGIEAAANALFSGCEDLYETALLVEEEEAATSAATNSTMAAPLRALAEAHGDRIIALGEQVQRVMAVKKSLDAALQRTTQLFKRAGCAVEDAATAALQGSGIIDRLQSAAVQQTVADTSAAVKLYELADELAELPNILQSPEQTAASLAIAVETLQMATAILGEIIHTIDWQSLSPSQDFGELVESVDTEAEHLIRKAQVTIGQLQHDLLVGTKEKYRT